jgi:hypothetical protein
MNSKFVINYLFLLLLFISCLSQGKVTEDGRIQYINRRYYFSIDLPSSWSNYSVFEYDEIVESDIKVKAIFCSANKIKRLGRLCFARGLCSFVLYQDF